MISVIVPAYNSGRYLRECLDSLTAQTDVDIEIILVDDGSTDDTAAIVRAYPAVRYIRQNNAGLSAARNAGLDAAKGDYISFCDADDAYAPHAFRVLGDCLDRHPNCDIASAAFIESATMPSEWNEKPDFELRGAIEALECTLYQEKGFHSSACAKLYRHRLFDNVRFVPGLYYEDLEITLRLYTNAKNVAVSRTPLYFYRNNPVSIINTWHPRRLHVLDVTDGLVAFVSERYPSLLPAARSRRFSAYFNMLVEGLRHNDEALVQRCYAMIKAERRTILADLRVRLKNKAGALASYFGIGFLRLLSR